jgi:hypothetical protein
MRRWTPGLLTALLALVVFGWILYIPQRALNPLRPIPAYAQVVYRSATPDWFFSFFPMLGENGSDLPRVWKKQFQSLKKCPLAVAVAPLGGRERRNTWIAVSAAGPHALLLRWRLTLFPPENIHSVGSYGAWPVWQLDEPELPVWARVRFAITEGLLICSISEDSHDIYYLLDTLDGRRPSKAAGK